MATVLIDRNIGDPTRLSDNNAKNDAIAELQASIGAATSAGLPNASFELDTDTDGEPDGWTATDNAGGSHSINTSESIGGTNAMEFVTTVGGGWVEMETTEFLKGGNVGGMLSGWFKTDTASVRIRVQVLEFDTEFSILNTTTFIDETPTNIDEWFLLSEGRYPVEGPYYKVKIIIGESGGSIGATVLLDQIEFNPKNTDAIIVESLLTVGDVDPGESETILVGYVYLTPSIDNVRLLFFVDNNATLAGGISIEINGITKYSQSDPNDGWHIVNTSNTISTAGWYEVEMTISESSSGSITGITTSNGLQVY